MATVTKPMALDETLQATNGKIDTTNSKLQSIADALGNITGQTLDGLTDVNITSPQDGDCLVYDANDSEWKNDASVRDDISKLYSEISDKNLNPYPYTNTTKTQNNVTFVDNGDGTVTVSTNGTASAQTDFSVQTWNVNLFLKSGTYILNGCPAGGSTSTYFLTMGAGIEDIGSGATFTNSLNPGSYGMTIRIKEGTAIPTPITFKPMIRDASIADDTWQPYGSAKIAKRTDLTSIIATGATNITGAQIPYGAYFYLNGVFCRAIADIASNATFTKDTNYIETTVSNDLNGLFFKGKDGQGQVLDATGESYTAPFNGFVNGTITSSNPSSSQASVRINNVTVARSFSSAVFVCFPCAKGTTISTTGTGTFDLYYSR